MRRWSLVGSVALKRYLNGQPNRVWQRRALKPQTAARLLRHRLIKLIWRKMMCAVAAASLAHLHSNNIRARKTATMFVPL